MPRNRAPVVLLAAVALSPGCADRRAGADRPASATGAPAATPAPTAREAMLAVPGGRIWYRLIPGGSGTPVILLHGGPGFSSIYMRSLEPLAADRPLVRYDQLGGGHSDGLSDTTAFTIPHFVAELDSLRASLGYARVHLLGHSWGTILAVEYYRAHPEHVASMVLGSAALDIPAWERHARALVGTLSDSAQHAIRRAEAAHAYDAADYQAALAEFYGKYVWRHPVEPDLDSLFKTVNEAIYNYMQGPSEFTITGTLKTYDVTSFLPSIRVPVLYTVGEFDEANPETVRRFAALTPGARVVVLPGSAHITMWDAPAENLRAVRNFLRSADSAGGTPATVSASARGLPVPATFSGTIPCADCPGIVLTVTLLADSTFRLRQEYQERPAILRQRGHWQLEENRARLVLRTGAGRPQLFAVTSPDSLRMLDAHGRPIESQANYTLVRAATVDPLSTTPDK